MATLDRDLRDYLRSGMPGMAVATDATGRPRTARIWAVFVDDVDDVLYLYVARASSPEFFSAVAAGGRVAASFVELPTYRSRMFKGPCAVVAPPEPRHAVDAWVADMGVSLTRVGLPPDSVPRMLGHFGPRPEMVTLRLVVEACFDQTPRRDAGGPL